YDRERREVVLTMEVVVERDAALVHRDVETELRRHGLRVRVRDAERRRAAVREREPSEEVARAAADLESHVGLAGVVGQEALAGLEIEERVARRDGVVVHAQAERRAEAAGLEVRAAGEPGDHAERVLRRGAV